jgi:signal transduction histidine kinase
MDQIVDQTLALAREGQSVGDTEPLSLASMAEQSWQVIETTGAELRVEDDTTVEADPERFQHLLENLYRNAVEHGSTSPPSHAHEDGVEHAGSQVTVTVGPTEDGFYVADDGPGIPESDRENVFEPGHTTTSDGTGFGLAIVAEIVDAHRGDITVTEGRDGGARFEISGFHTA